ncbi:Hsp20/alpha crystallin family protein [Geitlerinema sp. PCC 9228]|uniref:Hsp20/alpha crystallin family protein n=1 Tax=Geitlerinema sp. PCC 9228 TaxID=111611 RepID=UPI0008F99677|nr:Hsp20/alpha crystallin family protein [Geitlerinema sp. PCC 9228]
MAIVRWNPATEIEPLRRQMDRLFDEITGYDRGLTSTQTPWQPAIELRDNGDALHLRAAMPGMKAQDLDVNVSRNAVTIRGEHRQEEENQDKGFFRSEFQYGKFERVVDLPIAVNNEQAEGKFENGILNLYLPKLEQEKNSSVRVNIS